LSCHRSKRTAPNTFQRLIYGLTERLRNKDEGECRQMFDELIINTLKDEERVEQTFAGDVPDIFTYERFKSARNNGANFSKYLLIRIDRWLSQLLDKPSYCKAPLFEIEERFNKTNRRRYGMHLEHIYAHKTPTARYLLIPRRDYLMKPCSSRHAITWAWCCC
jgi:hypothetical protein